MHRKRNDSFSSLKQHSEDGLSPRQSFLGRRNNTTTENSSSSTTNNNSSHSSNLVQTSPNTPDPSSSSFSLSSMPSSPIALLSTANCRVSSFIFGATAISIAVVCYLAITKFVFPLVTQYHDQSHHVHHNQDHDHQVGDNNNNNHDDDSSAASVNKMTLCLIVGLSCAISTAVPGLFTVSCLAAGFALDFLLGSFVAIVATLVGLSISFEAGRTLFRERASALVAARFPSAQNLSQLHPTKAVWVSWFFPVPLAIKIFFWSSCSNVSLWRFLASVVVVAVPHISTLAFIGDRASSLGEGKAGSHEKVFFVLGSVSVGIVSLALSKWAKNAVVDPNVSANTGSTTKDGVMMTSSSSSGNLNITSGGGDHES